MELGDEIVFRTGFNHFLSAVDSGATSSGYSKEMTFVLADSAVVLGAGSVALCLGMLLL